MVWTSHSFDKFCCHDVIVNNLRTMITILERSDDNKKQFKIESYRNALKNLPHKEISSMRDIANVRIAGPSIMDKIQWIIETKKNLPEVEEEELRMFNETYENYASSDEDEDEASSSGHNPNSSNNQKEDFRTTYLSTICHIEGQMYLYMDMDHPEIKQILRKFQLLRNEYSVIDA